MIRVQLSGSAAGLEARLEAEITRRLNSPEVLTQVLAKLERVMRDAVGQVAGDNLSGKGREVAAFRDDRAGSYRSWLEDRYGSDRERMMRRAEDEFLLHAAEQAHPTATQQARANTTPQTFGFQTGLLSKAWYDLDVHAQLVSRGLELTFTPSPRTTAGSPEAKLLTAALARQAGSAWHGLSRPGEIVAELARMGVIAYD